MSKYWRTLYRHVAGRNVRYSDFSPSSAVDVVETKTGIGQIVLALKCIKTFVSCGLFTTFVCCSQHVEILTNAVSARHRAKCTIFLLIAKFGDRRRRNENEYRPDCFNAERYQNLFLERIIYHDCLLLATRRNIDELCIGTSPGKCPIGLTLKCMRTVFSSKLFTTIVCFLQHVEIWTNSVLARHLAKCAIFGFRRRRNEKGYRLDCFSAEGYQNCSFV